MSDTLSITSPWSGECVLSLPLDDAEAICAKVEKARQIATRWRTLPLPTRQVLVEDFITAVAEQTDSVALSVTQQMGKPISEARGEVGTMLARARMMHELAPDALCDHSIALGDGIHRRVVRDPLGVIVDIAAWNYPLLIAVNVVVPAVLAGNAVLLKHASQTAGVGLFFERIFREIGAPDGLVTAVTVRGRDAGALIRHSDVDGVFFTGSVPAGRQVYGDVATRPTGFIDVGLELGGKDPAYVRHDMPLDIVVPNLVEGAFFNAGQSCCAVERIYVHSELYPKFVEMYLEEAKRWVVGPPESEDTVMGPLATPEGLKTLDHQVRQAVDKGGRLLLGGERLSGLGWAYPATVIADANHSMELMTEESFGPIIGLMPVDGDDEALRLMNDSQFGLTASIWTADHEQGERLARRVRAGTVYVNRCDYVDPCLPWTGFKESGKGVTLSSIGFEHLTRVRGLHTRPLSLMR